ncbi:MAG: pyridoxal-phosphate dependent enzyme [Acidobacteriaceae bacterium]|nr:pyridoxal-phosphate dependent enzyme [Acidobacteriaceae bacterium]MBV9781869.1 pyridoxal-phosphate dependent enzyme [Acidobacteriaceae bacterium]
MSMASTATKQTVSLDDVLQAAERIKALARKTPVLSSRLFDEAAGARTRFKCENFQRGGSFKIRGALNFLMSLSESERKRGVVTYSSGNHAQAVAMAAAHLGVAATIVMPTDAPKAKLESTLAYRPKIVFFDRQRENREEIARKIADETGAVVLPSYDHPWIIAGQGTAALEMLREETELQALVVPLGGGGLLSGTLVVAKTLRPDILVFGVEPALANDWYLSLERGERVEIPPPPTVADGLRTPVPGQITFPIVQALVSGVFLVSEEEIKETMRFLLTRLKILTEPSGAVAAAAVLHGKLPSDMRSLGVILSGGNVDLDIVSEVCRGA